MDSLQPGIRLSSFGFVSTKHSSPSQTKHDQPQRCRTKNVFANHREIHKSSTSATGQLSQYQSSVGSN